MKNRANSVVVLMGLVLFAIVATNAFGQEGMSSRSPFPQTFTIKDEFRPGIGQTVGQVQATEGEVVIVHRGDTWGVRAIPGRPLYAGDEVYTLENAKAQLKLADESVVSMGTNAKLAITKSLYDPEGGRRSSFFRSDWGKARFLIRKLMEFRQSEVQVKTNTAVAGVRGSDFVVDSRELPCLDLPDVPEPLRRPGEMCGLTIVTAFADTQVEVASVAVPDQPPVLVSDFTQTRVASGAPPTEPEPVPVESIDVLKGELPITAQVVPQEEEQKEDTRKAQKSAPEEEADQSAQAADMAAPPEGPTGVSGGESVGVLVPEGELISPEELTQIGDLDAFVIDEIIESEATVQAEEQAAVEQQQASEERIEDAVRELPGLPGPPP